MTWRIARSLTVLLAQFNRAFPNRSKASDGGIGNDAHAAEGWTNSDHNPWYPSPNGGIVTARDFTHDPAHGMDINVITDQLAAGRDHRIKYIIANGYILDSRPWSNPWKWMPYRGANPHNKHFHLSVMNDTRCDDKLLWQLPMLGEHATLPVIGAGSLPTLLFGRTSPIVASLQRFLNAFDWTPDLPILTVDGDYGNATAGVLKSAQTQMHVTGGDGRTVGPQTKNALWLRGWRG